MKKRLLYIGRAIAKPANGGEICCVNNQLVLRAVFSDRFDKYTLSKENTLEILFNKFFLLYPGLQVCEFRKIHHHIELLSPDYVFIETAQYGALVKYIKKIFPLIKVVTFFHNIEIEYAKSYFSLKNIKSWYFYFLTKHNETCSIRYSDYCMTINESDSELMQKTYGRKPDCIFPFSIKDRLSESDIALLEADKQKIHKHECLFVGSNFFGNTDGLTWFIQNILPQTNVHLTIVGSGMSKAFSNSEKITVFDYVEDLSVFYRETDFVLLPIISGGGMKTKTADAMMYGKAIVGTPDVFFGYDISDLHGIYICRTPEDFVQATRNIYNDDIFDFNLKIHKRFAEKHSIESTCVRVCEFFTENEKEFPSC